MSVRAQTRLLDRLGHSERLEQLSERFGLPAIAEYELADFGRLYARELRLALEELDGACAGKPAAGVLAWRGRMRRLLGDEGGARADLRASIAGGAAPAALAWLGELELGRREATGLLQRAVELAPRSPWAELYLGAARWLEGDLEAARSRFDRSADLAPAAALPRLLLGRAYEMCGRRERARAAYSEALRRAPGCSAAALCLSRVERGPRSLAACERALDAEPTYAFILLSWSRPRSQLPAKLRRLRRFAIDQPERAAQYDRLEDVFYAPYPAREHEHSKELLSERRGSAWAWALAARGALRSPPESGLVEEGAAAIERAVRLAPAQGWLYAWRGLARMKQGRLEDARRDFSACLRLQPFYHRAYAWRGALLRKLGRPSEALEDLDRAVAFDESYSFAAHERSLAHRALGDWTAAASELDRAFRLEGRYGWAFSVGREPARADLDAWLAELDQAVAERPSVPSLRVWRAQVRLRRSELSEALLDLDDALALDPLHALAQGWRAAALLEAGRFDDAVAAARRAVQLEPRTPALRVWLADAELGAGRPRKALSVLDAALRTGASRCLVRERRARVLLAAGRPKRAEAEAARAIALEGRHAETYHVLGQARLAQGKLLGAARAVEKALRLSPHLGRAYLLRAGIFERLGRADRVLEDYRTVLERFPFLFNDAQRRRVEGLLRA